MLNYSQPTMSHTIPQDLSNLAAKRRCRLSVECLNRTVGARITDDLFSIAFQSAVHHWGVWRYALCW